MNFNNDRAIVVSIVVIWKFVLKALSKHVFHQPLYMIMVFLANVTPRIKKPQGYVWFIVASLKSTVVDSSCSFMIKLMVYACLKWSLND